MFPILRKGFIGVLSALVKGTLKSPKEINHVEPQPLDGSECLEATFTIRAFRQSPVPTHERNGLFESFNNPITSKTC